MKTNTQWKDRRPCVCVCVCVINLTSQRVIQQIDKLRINISPGVYKEYPRVLNECKNIISVAITDIFNKSIASGDVLSL